MHDNALQTENHLELITRADALAEAARKLAQKARLAANRHEELVKSGLVGRGPEMGAYATAHEYLVEAIGNLDNHVSSARVTFGALVDNLPEAAQ